MSFPVTSPFNKEQKDLIETVKRFIKKKNPLSEETAKDLLNKAEEVKISHRGPEIHTGRNSKNMKARHVHINGYHLVLEA